MYSESGMAINSASVSSAAGVVFQLLANLASFLMDEGSAATMGGVGVDCV
jgi:hypothetical protein